MNHHFRNFGTILLSLVISYVAISAQSTSARIVGAVTDGSGQPLPNVSLKVTSLDTGATRTATADAEGNYSVSNLSVGSYEVAVEANGFKRFVQRSVRLAVEQTARVDIKLEVGLVTESVTVEGGAPLIETERSGIGQVVENKTIVQLPLNGRNFIRLGSLIPGTTEGAPGNTFNRDRQGGSALTANGQRAEYNNFMLDGVDNNSTLNGVATIVPSVDALQEFKVQTSNYSAEFGRAAGAVVNIAIKQGTNDYHGSAYEFLRNDVLDARNPFAFNSASQPAKTPLRRNQFGGTIGGPISFPKAIFGPLGGYSGRNRTFIFFNYEGLRIRRGTFGRFQVPTVAQRGGDFTGQPTIYNPFNVVGGARQAFPNNRIPDALISPIARRLLDLIPQPNASEPGGINYIQQFSNPSDGAQYHLRGDHAVTPNDLWMARYSVTRSTSANRTINFNGDSTEINTKGGVIGYTKIISPKAVNDARFGTQRYEFNSLPEGFGTDGVTPTGLPLFASGERFLRYPTITMRNLTGIGGNTAIPLQRVENTFQWSDTLTLTLGKQSLKVGGDARRYQLNNFQPQFSSGNYNFTGAFTSTIGSQYATGLPDLLLGLPASETILNSTGFDANRLRNTRLSLFAQDDWQIASRLTLNLGLRWERDGAWREKDDRWAYFDFTRGQVVYPKTAKTPFQAFPYPFRFDDNRDIKKPQNNAFAPRFGFALRPFNHNRTVVRGAYGIFFGQPLGFLALNSAITFPPFSLRQVATSGTTTPQLRIGVFPGVNPSTLIATNPGGLFSLNPDELINGYVQQWNFGIEQEIVRDVALKVSYVGNKGTHLERRYEANPALPPAAGAINPRRRFPLFQNILQQESNSFSSYHSLQVTGEKRFSKGVLFLIGYTWSKSLDDTSTWSGLGGQESPLPQDPSRIFLEKGRSGFDLRQRLTATWVYETPFKSSNRFANALISGWQLSGLATFRTGYPFSVIVGGDVPNAGTGNTRASLIGDPVVPNDQRTVGRWFNTAAFAQPANFTFGTSGRNILDGPGARQVDAGILRFFKITERHGLQFRWEMFNALNHPVFGLPNATFANAAFGRLGGASNREMQVALKYLF
ncbi:MAG: TonB-dependent receptor [Blastocatellia bacterium]|nr:TonB-dependent receptor [Blastocatellia bacterium]